MLFETQKKDYLFETQKKDYITSLQPCPPPQHYTCVFNESFLVIIWKLADKFLFIKTANSLLRGSDFFADVSNSVVLVKTSRNCFE